MHLLEKVHLLHLFRSFKVICVHLFNRDGRSSQEDNRRNLKIQKLFFLFTFSHVCVGETETNNKHC